jgi:exodeoxyribonuclease V alpha subunit
MSIDLEAISRTRPPEEDVLARGRALGILSPLDAQFARRLARLYGETDPDVVWALALVCRQEAAGHVCADLARLEVEGVTTEVDGVARRDDARIGSESLEAWRSQLEASRLVEAADELQRAAEAEPRPLVLDSGGRLYLRRSFENQQRLANAVRTRAESPDFEVDWCEAESRLDRLAPDSVEEVDWARVALRVGLARPLTIVTGGPGTGKTTLVVRLIAALIDDALAHDRTVPRVRLLAPTGKAAAALTASIARVRRSLDVSEEVRASLPTNAETIHRALHRQTRRDAFGRPQRLRLDEDVVVVDEASMVDLALMARLFDSCETVGRLILLGDPDQLASVESGAVLAELCSARVGAVGEGGTPVAGSDFETPGVPSRRPPRLADSLVTLQESHRFEAGGAIGRLAEAIRAGDADLVLELLEDPSRPEIERCDVESVDAVRARLIEASCEAQRAIRETVDGAAKLARLGVYRVLCTHRRGALGVESLCAVLDEALASEWRTTRGSGWWRGRMLLVTRNAPDQDLWNGDVGLVEQTESGLRALFPDGVGGVRALSAGRLPAHESAIAMSIHKSQGSEFETVDLVLGSVASRLMTRELLYTGVTRARNRLRIHATTAVIRDALARRVQRDSGLSERLGIGGNP